MKMRIALTKQGDMVFISLLDLQTFLQRALRRANIPVAYSNGFNPHPKIEYGPSVGLFVKSRGEFLDITLKEPMDEATFIHSLAPQLPKGMEIVYARALQSQDKALSKAIRAAWFCLRYTTTMQDTEALESFFQNDALIIRKKNKKGILVEKEVRPSLYAYTIRKEGSWIYVRLQLSQQPNMLINVSLLSNMIATQFAHQLNLKDITKEETLFF